MLRFTNGMKLIVRKVMVLMVMVLVMENYFLWIVKKKEKRKRQPNTQDNNYSSLAQTTQPAEGKSVII